MALRSQILEIVQLGKESTFGVAVAADKRLYGLRWTMDPNIPAEKDMAQGVKSSTGVIVAKERTDFTFEGNAAYNDLAYLFAMSLCSPVVTSPGASAKLFTYQPSATDADTFDSFTHESGSSLGASQVAGLRGDGIDLTFVPDRAVTVRGKAFGKAVDDTVTMTPSPTGVLKKSISPRNIDVYVADSEAGLATGQIKPLQTTWSLRDRHTPVYELDSSEASYSDSVEKALDGTAQIIVPQDSAANGYMTELRAAATKFCQIVATGAEIESGLPWLLRLTFPFNFLNPKRQAQQDVHCGVYDMEWCYDETFGGTVKAEIQTTMAAL